MKTVKLTALVFWVLVFSPGCIDVDVGMSKTTSVRTVEGDATLNKAHASFHGELLDAYTVKAGKVKKGDLEKVRIEQFFVERVLDGVAVDGRVIGLEFVQDLEIRVRPVDEDSELPEVTVAWFEAGDEPLDNPYVIEFEVDPSVELLPYFLEGFEFTAEGAWRVPASNVQVRGHAIFSGVHSWP